MEWISVKDRLPEIGVEVNVYRPDSLNQKVTSLCRLVRYEGAINYFWDNLYGTSNIHLPEAITHWMPLPEPPKTYKE